MRNRKDITCLLTKLEKIKAEHELRLRRIRGPTSGANKYAIFFYDAVRNAEKCAMHYLSAKDISSQVMGHGGDMISAHMNHWYTEKPNLN
jgi:hypothetical protein